MYPSEVEELSARHGHMLEDIGKFDMVTTRHYD